MDMLGIAAIPVITVICFLIAEAATMRTTQIRHK